MIDTGCNRRSLISIHQLRAYSKERSSHPNIQTSDHPQYKKCQVRTLGSVVLPIPLPDLGISVDMPFCVVREPHWPMVAI